MQKSNLGTSIVEAIVLTLIISLWLFGMYNIFDSSQKLSNTTQNRIQAIAIAREWIEVLINIRDTNWKNYSANNSNCWNTLNYNVACVLGANNNHIISTGSYILYQDEHSRWSMSGGTTGTFTDETYRNTFWMQLDANWLYTQSWGTTLSGTIFTREIQISYPNDAWNPPQKMTVKSIVQWSDSAKTWLQKIEIDTILTNWKK